MRRWDVKVCPYGRFHVQKLFGGWMRSRANVGDASKSRSSESCSGCYRASAVGFLSEIHEGTDLRQSAKQLPIPSHVQPFIPKFYIRIWYDGTLRASHANGSCRRVPVALISRPL